MKATDCKSYVNCNASLCPLDEESLKSCLWYPDEEVCKTIHTTTPFFIKQQRKIQKKFKNTDNYFTYEMLKQNFVVKTGIEGLDPDKEESPQMLNWLKNHRGRRELTDKEKRDIAERLNKARNKSIMLIENRGLKIGV